MNEHDDAYVDAMLMVNMQANTRSVTDMVTKTKTTTRIGTHDTSMSVPSTWCTPSSEAKFSSNLNEKESS